MSPGARGRLALLPEGATPEQAAAIVAALEQFAADTAPAPAPSSGEPFGWARAALLEGVEREPDPLAGEAWINT